MSVHTSNRKIWCPQHKVVFQASQFETTFRCPIGNHRVAKGFPLKNIWSACTECGLHWISVAENITTLDCPSCGPEPGHFYLCTECQVISLVPSIQLEDQDDTDEIVSPFDQRHCSGCGRGMVVDRLHFCPRLQVQLDTSRSGCPICEQPILVSTPDPPGSPDLIVEPVVEPFHPLSVADFLQENGRPLSSATFDRLEQVFYPQPEGSFLLWEAESNGQRKMLVVPIANFILTKSEFRIIYSSVFDCAVPIAGELIIVEPAEADLKGRLVKKGRVAIRQMNEAQPALDLPTDELTSDAYSLDEPTIERNATIQSPPPIYPEYINAKVSPDSTLLKRFQESSELKRYALVFLGLALALIVVIVLFLSTT